MTNDQQDQTLTTLEELEAVISLDADHLEREIQQFTADLSRKGRQFAEATRVAALMHLQAKRVTARLTLEVRHAAEMAGSKLTDKLIEASVISMDAWYQAHKNDIDAAAKRDELKADVAALEGKERMLDLLGRKMIAEMRKDPAASVAAAEQEGSTTTWHPINK